MGSFKAVLFDFDGTLTRPGSIDFGVLRSLLGCPPKTPILEHIESLGSVDERARAMHILEEFELEAARQSAPNSGAEQLIGLLAATGVGRGIITRNCRASILEALKSFPTITLEHFDVVLSRESPGRPKPHPDGILAAARAFRVSPERLLVVGDYVFDIEAGKNAGAYAAFLTNGSPVPPMSVRPDFIIAELSEVRGILGI